MALSRDLKEFLSLLVAHEVRFMLVGAHAAAVYGHSRNTEDIDFWVERSAPNASRLLVAIRDFGFESLGLKEADLLDPDTVIQLGRAPNRIDLLTFLTGLQFEPCFARHEAVTFEGLTIPVIAFDDLLANKQATGRPKDLLDVAALSKAPPTG